MIGHRQRLVGGDEYDAITAAAKHVHHWRPGQRAAVKRMASKRARRKAKARITETGRAAREIDGG